MNKIKHIFIVFLTSIVVILFCSCNTKKNTPVNSEIFALSTVITQQVYGKNSSKAVKEVENLINSLENQFSMYKQDSDISKINANAGVSPVKVDDYTFDLLTKAKDYSEKSNGIFDITIAPLTKLWGIDSSEPHIPTEDELERLLPKIDYQKLVLNNEEKECFLKENGMALDLGGIAKGDFCSRIKEIYDDNNISSALVSIGGNIFAYKTKLDGTAYNIGLRTPEISPNSQTFAKLKMNNSVLATTGAYERYFEQNGKIYHHILDTKTGFPVETDLLSVSVICKDGGLADFLSTTLFIAGSEYIQEYLNRDDFQVVVVDKNKNVYVSDKLKNDFVLDNNEYILK